MLARMKHGITDVGEKPFLIVGDMREHTGKKPSSAGTW